MHTCTHTCTYTHTRICTHAHMHAHMHTCMHTYTHACTHAHMHVHKIRQHPLKHNDEYMYICSMISYKLYGYTHAHTHGEIILECTYNYLHTVFCNNDEQARTIACEYYKPKLLHHPVWTVNGTNSRDCITVTTLNATHHIAVLNYSNFQPGAYQVKLEFSRLVGHLKTFCQDLVPLYKTTIIVTGMVPCNVLLYCFRVKSKLSPQP